MEGFYRYITLIAIYENCLPNVCGHIGISFDAQVRLVNSTYAEVTKGGRIVRNQDITQLVASDDGEYIYALTAQQVRMLI